MGLKKKHIRIGSLAMKNPVMTASGTFGYGTEYAGMVNLDRLGAIVTKTVTLEPRPGNPVPRIYEISCGMINSIGLQNTGIDTFIAEKIPAIKKLTNTPVIASIGGTDPDEFEELAARLSKTNIDAVEINISCPNIKDRAENKNKLLISQDAGLTYNTVRKARRKYNGVIIVKLSPAVTDITEIAKSAEKAGADALTVANSFPAAYIDGKSGKIKFGGLSGPVLKNIALKLVYETAAVVSIPVIGCGGIISVNDAREFLHAGALAVQVGSGIFADPQTAVRIAEEI